MNPAGNGLAYSTYLGGSGVAIGALGDFGYGVALDNSGGAYVAGAAYSADFPTTDGSFQTSTNATSGQSNAFIAKFALPSALSCQLTDIVNGPPKQIMITMQDVSPGLKTIQLTSSTNATVAIPSFVAGTTSPVVVTATKINQSESSDVAFTISSMSGATASCDPVDYTATIEKGPRFIPSGNLAAPNITFVSSTARRG